MAHPIESWLPRGAVVRCSSRQVANRSVPQTEREGGSDSEASGSCSGFLLRSTPCLVLTNASVLGGCSSNETLSWKATEPGVYAAEIRRAYRKINFDVLTQCPASGNTSSSSAVAHAPGENAVESWQAAWPLSRIRVQRHRDAVRTIVAALSVGGEDTERSGGDELDALVDGASDFIVLQVRPDQTSPARSDAGAEFSTDFGFPSIAGDVCRHVYKGMAMSLVSTPFADACPKLFSASVTRGIVSNVLNTDRSSSSAFSRSSSPSSSGDVIDALPRDRAAPRCGRASDAGTTTGVGCSMCKALYATEDDVTAAGAGPNLRCLGCRRRHRADAHGCCSSELQRCSRRDDCESSPSASVAAAAASPFANHGESSRHRPLAVRGSPPDLDRGGGGGGGASRAVSLMLIDAPCVAGCEGGMVLTCAERPRLVGFLSLCLTGHRGDWLGLSAVCPAGPLLQAVALVAGTRLAGAAARGVGALSRRRLAITSEHACAASMGHDYLSRFTTSPSSPSVAVTSTSSLPASVSTTTSSWPLRNLDRCVVAVRCGSQWASGVVVVAPAVGGSPTPRCHCLVLTCRHAVEASVDGTGLRVVITAATTGLRGAVVSAVATPIATSDAGGAVDLAVLALSGEDCERLRLAAIPLRTANVPAVPGEPVLTAGYPLMPPDLVPSPTLTHGVVSRVHGSADGLRGTWYQTSASVSRGASGGALVCAATRQLLAILSSNIRGEHGVDFPHLNFSQPVHLLAGPIREFEKTGDDRVLVDALAHLDAVCRAEGPDALLTRSKL